jgi:hypothetical protein
MAGSLRTTGTASQAAGKCRFGEESSPQRLLKPNSLHGSYVRPLGRTLQRSKFFRNLFSRAEDALFMTRLRWDETARFLAVHVRAIYVRNGILWSNGKSDRRASPGFPVDLVGVGELHAAFLNESRTRGRWWRPVAGNPGRPSFSAHVRWGEGHPSDFLRPLP